MKKIIFNIIICLLSVVMFNACSDSEFEKHFKDPSKTEFVTVEKLMTGTFEASNRYTMPWYWRYYTFEIPQTGRYTQIMGFINSNEGAYQPSDSYSNDRWSDFYKSLTQFRLLEYTWENMAEPYKSDNEIYKHVTQVFIYDHLQQLIDCFGDVPYYKAGYLGLTLDIEGSKPEYDSAEELYRYMLKDLKSINEFLINNAPNSIVGPQLVKQDYINDGDIMAWRRYANSLRLRIASRAAAQGPLAEEARAVIKEILSDADTYPIVTNNSENIQVDFRKPGLNAVDDQHEKGIQGGFESSSGYYNRGSKTYIDALKDDPRLEIIFDTNAEGNYEGIDPLMSSTEQEDLFKRPNDKGGNFYSAVDTATFSRNDKFPGVIISASEVEFIRAEAILKWGAPGDAETAFKSGVEKSVEFYYYLNGLGEYRKPITAPSAEEIADFAAEKWNNYSNKEEAVAVQKWVHFGLIQMTQAWHEYRKTGYPELEFMESTGSADVKTPPSRLRYPTDERTLNYENYQKMQSKDGYYDELFWAKPLNQ